MMSADTLVEYELQNKIEIYNNFYISIKNEVDLCWKGIQKWDGFAAYLLFGARPAFLSWTITERWCLNTSKQTKTKDHVS